MRNLVDMAPELAELMAIRHPILAGSQRRDDGQCIEATPSEPVLYSLALIVDADCTPFAFSPHIWTEGPCYVVQADVWFQLKRPHPRQLWTLMSFGGRRPP